MRSLLLKNVLLDGVRTNILIENGRFCDLHAAADAAAETVYDASGEAIVPSFFNTHTHAAMTLLRGYADDMPLFTWLNDHIWPFEARMRPSDIYDGSRLAILEMIRSGTTFFCDMYWMVEETVRAVEEMGVRAAIGVSLMDRLGAEKIARDLEFLAGWKSPAPGRIELVVAPHAVYTVGPELMQRCAEAARANGQRLTLHVSETAQEVADCVRTYGMSPVRWLDKLGVLGPNVIAAHCVHVDPEEMAILAERGVTVAHNPCSNMKLSSGICPAAQLAAAGCNVTIGTDGASSNNNLDMREEMKFAALLAKVSGSSETLPAHEALQWATANGARAFGLDAGRIAPGALADAVLLDLSNERLNPNYNLVSNWVYAADSRAVSSVICDGRLLMQRGCIEGEEEIIARAREAVARLTA